MDPTDYSFKVVTKKVPILQGAEHPKIPWWPCLVLSPASGGTYISILAHLQPPFSTEGSFPLPQLAATTSRIAVCHPPGSWNVTWGLLDFPVWPQAGAVDTLPRSVPWWLHEQFLGILFPDGKGAAGSKLDAVVAPHP